MTQRMCGDESLGPGAVSNVGIPFARSVMATMKVRRSSSLKMQMSGSRASLTQNAVMSAIWSGVQATSCMMVTLKRAGPSGDVRMEDGMFESMMTGMGPRLTKSV